MSAGGGAASGYERVLEGLGAAICAGELAPGTVVTLEELIARTGASRTVVREAVRALSTMGLVQARQRVGVRVLSQASWNLFDHRVIRWRLGSETRAEQVTALRQMRLAIEPEAARLAARRGEAGLTGRLVSVAGSLWTHGREGDPEGFLAEDDAFHRLMLRASGNAMFVQLADVIAEALRERARLRPHVEPIDLEDVQLHVDLAHHVQRGEEEPAWRAAREIVLRNEGPLDPG